MARLSLFFALLLFFAGLTIAVPVQNKIDAVAKPDVTNTVMKKTVRSGSNSDSGSGSGSDSDSDSDSDSGSGSGSGSGSDSDGSNSNSDSES